MFDFIAAADLHLTNERPEKRKGNYVEQIFDKFEQILKITKSSTKTNLLLVAGDFFDSPTVPYNITREVIKLLKKYNTDILGIPGQHDIRYHQSGLKDTPLGVLVESGFISVENKTNLDITLAGWNEEPKEDSEIIVIHKMITEKFGLFPGHDYTNAKTILKQYPLAKLIISGDNHRPHLVKYKNRFQLNCGSMVRKTKDQIDYIPSVWGIKIFPEIEIHQLKLNIESQENVFDFDKIEKEEIQNEIKKEAEELINKFTQELEKEESTKISFPKILKKVIDETKPKKEVIQKVSEIMEKIQK
jgi:DNA repair exonuclease SbcCD nuclease subunit